MTHRYRVEHNIATIAALDLGTAQEKIGSFYRTLGGTSNEFGIAYSVNTVLGGKHVGKMIPLDHESKNNGEQRLEALREQVELLKKIIRNPEKYVVDYTRGGAHYRLKTP